MEPWIRKRALEAAAKVALSVTSLGACGGKALVPDGVDSGDPTESTQEIFDSGIARVEAGPCGPFPGATSAEPTVRCCHDLVASSADAAVETWSEAAARPDVVACCHSILSACDRPSAVPGCAFYDVVSFVCCPILGSNTASFCGPWGPPTPPAMPGGEELV
jgi:hypothetical protein